MEMKKTCRKCGKTSSIDKFCKQKNTKDGLSYYCFTCKQDWKLKSKYGISKEESDILYRNQKGHCLICNNFFYRNKLVVDHNHKTGKVRGLLCSPCNRGIGLLRDDANVLINAIKYLINENETPDQGATNDGRNTSNE